MSERDAIERHIQLLIDMNEPINSQDRMLAWSYSEITKLEAQVAQWKEAAQALMDEQGHCTYWGNGDKPKIAKDTLYKLLEVKSDMD